MAQTPAEDTPFDLIVLGLGPGGEDVAGRMAEAGWSVLGVDAALVGGECPYYGCIPSKMILRGAELLAEARRVDGVAGHATVEPDYTPVANRIRDEATDDWDDRAAVARFEGKGGTFVRGAGRLAGRDAAGHLLVSVGERTYRGARVVVSTGTAPAVPPIPGLAELRESDGAVWTNREAMRARSAPASLVVLGGGAVGCELGQGFARFGTRVTILETGPRILSAEEPEAAAVVTEVLRREGVDVRENAAVESVSGGMGEVVVTLTGGETVSATTLLIAAGRRPNLADVGLESVGLDPQARTLDIDERMRVLAGGAAVDGLYSVGDVTGHGAFTHVSVWQARVLANHLLGGEHDLFGGYHGLAWVTFTDPEIGRVGMSERQARESGLRVRIGTSAIAASTRGWIHGPGNDGLVKLVEDADRGVLVGATVVGPYGGEILGLLTLAVHARVPVGTLATMHYAYPTLHRSVLEAVNALG